MVYFRTGSTRLWLTWTNVHIISVMAKTVASRAVKPGEKKWQRKRERERGEGEGGRGGDKMTPDCTHHNT